MNKIAYKIKKIIYRRICRIDTMELDMEYYRGKGVKVGKNVRAFSPLLSAEPYLLEFGNNITVSSDVKFITHDNSVIKVIDGATDIFGKIVIKDNCFIGQNSILLPGIVIGENTIIGAGSVVTKSFQEGNIIIAGNPAKKICDIAQYERKIKPYCLNTKGLSYNHKKEYLLINKESLINK